MYKNTAFLKAVLDSISYQTIKPDEIIISEDGNDSGMRDFVNSYPFTINYQHLTQEDLGWQKNKALNNAIKSAKNDYLIFIDGDCVLHPKFIENHLKLAEPQLIQAGKRVKLGVMYSKQLIDSDVNTFAASYNKNYAAIKKDGGKFCEEGTLLPLNKLTKKITQLLGISSIKGCNFSCYKDALIAINGFDEDYILPAIGEDIDLGWRFKGLGYTISSIKHFAIQYHLHHQESWTDQSKNEAIMHQKMAKNLFRCINGLSK